MRWPIARLAHRARSVRRTRWCAPGAIWRGWHRASIARRVSSGASGGGQGQRGISDPRVAGLWRFRTLGSVGRVGLRVHPLRSLRAFGGCASDRPYQSPRAGTKIPVAQAWKSRPRRYDLMSHSCQDMLMPDGLETRQALLDDLDALTPLFDAYRTFYAQKPDPDRARAFLHERLALRESVIYLAEWPADGGMRAVGLMQLYPGFSSVAARRLWILNDLFVAAPSPRGRGVGRALLARRARMPAHRRLPRDPVHRRRQPACARAVRSLRLPARHRHPLCAAGGLMTSKEKPGRSRVLSMLVRDCSRRRRRHRRGRYSGSGMDRCRRCDPRRHAHRHVAIDHAGARVHDRRGVA